MEPVVESIVQATIKNTLRLIEDDGDFALTARAGVIKIINNLCGSFPGEAVEIKAHLAEFVHTLDEKRPQEKSRRHRRYIPVEKKALFSVDGRAAFVEILDVSRSGVSVRTTLRPEVGSVISIGDLSLTFARRFDGGVACRFTTLLASETLCRTISF